MPSRRQFLAGAGVASLAAVGGGAAAVQSYNSGTVYQKSVSATRTINGERYQFDVLTLLLSDDSNTVWGNLAKEFAGAYEPPATLHVDDDLHSQLSRRFDQVEYFVTFVENGNLYGKFSRTGFNRLGVGDTAQVLTYDWLDADAQNSVLSVTDREPSIARREITTYSLEERTPE